MRNELRRRLDKLIEEERKSAIDDKLLAKLNNLASEDTLYESFSPIERNTLNEFFREVKDYLLEELLKGNYGAQIILDAVIVLCFETGFKLAKGRD